MATVRITANPGTSSNLTTSDVTGLWAGLRRQLRRGQRLREREKNAQPGGRNRQSAQAGQTLLHIRVLPDLPKKRVVGRRPNTSQGLMAPQRFSCGLDWKRPEVATSVSILERGRDRVYVSPPVPPAA